MNWAYIAGLFDGDGNLHLNFVKNKTQLQLLCRIYNTNIEVLEKIKEFIDYGHIYANKKINKEWTVVHALTISKKKDVFSFLKNISPHLIIKRNQVNYALKNYKFGRESNVDFNIGIFRSFTTRRNTHKFTINYKLVRSTE